MPELPDLEYIRPILAKKLIGQTLIGLEIFEPVILRNMLGAPLDNLQSQVLDVRRHGPFIWILLDELETRNASADSNHSKIELDSRESQAAIVIHPMLAGRFRLNGKKQSSTAIRFRFFDYHLDYLDDRKMGKVYVCRSDGLDQIPGFRKQGMDVLSADFSLDLFQKLAAKSRKQVRVFIMDQSLLSSIGNAYADEILFEAGLHPKTRMNQLSQQNREKLYESIQTVLRAGMHTIQEAKPDLELKYRDHMKVRNKKDQPCPRCGNRIRRANVLGYDSFFCPVCQPDGGRGFIDWNSLAENKP